MTSAENKGPACVYTQAGVSVSKKSFSPRVEQEYTVGPAGFRVLCPRKPGAILETGSLHPPLAALRLLPLLGFPAHTLPYRHGEFTTSIDSHPPACVETQAGGRCMVSVGVFPDRSSW